MKTIGDLTYPEKPPRYWIAAKQASGLSDPALFRIWWSVYSDDEIRLLLRQ